MKKRVLLIVLAMVLVAALSVGLTLAYLTSQDSVTNTFTVGKVEIDLDEADVTGYGDEAVKTVNDTITKIKVDSVNSAADLIGTDRVERNDDYKLIPGHSYIKDPTVTVKAGSEDCYVRMKVTVNNYDKLLTIFSGENYAENLPYIVGDTLLLQYLVDWNDDNWKFHSVSFTTKTVEDEEVKDTATYEFRYYSGEKQYVDVDANDIDIDNGREGIQLAPLFTKINFPGFVTGEELQTLTGLQIDVEAHAIQADGFTDANAAWAAFNAQNND